MNYIAKRLLSVSVSGATLLSSFTGVMAGEADDVSVSSLTLQPGITEKAVNVTWYAEGEVSAPQVSINGQVFEASAEPVTVPTGYTEENNQYTGYTVCKAEIDGLEPAKEYTYTISNDGNSWSHEYTYTTPAEDSFRFAFTSDPQIKESGETDSNGWNPSDGTNQTGWDAMMQTIGESGATLVVSAGDQVEDQSWGKKSEYDAFFAPEEMSSIAYAPAVGNHDRHYMFRDHFNLPNEMAISEDETDDAKTLTEVKTTFRGQNSGTSLSHGNYTKATEQEIADNKNEKGVIPDEDGMYDYTERREMETEGNYYYLYDNVLFVTLNTGAYPGGNDEENAGNESVPSAEKDNSEAEAIVANFEKTLAAATSDYSGQYDWLIVTHHKSTQTVAKHAADSDIENYVDAGFEQLMEDYDVDFVLGGHDHVYSRSYVLNGSGERVSERLDTINDPQGTIYLTGNCASDMQYYTPFAAVDKANNEDYPVLANGERGSEAYLKGFTAQNPEDYLPVGNQEYNQEYSPSYAIFDVDGGKISVNVYDLDGDAQNPSSKKVDSFTVTKNMDGGEKADGFENGSAAVDITETARYDSGMTNADGGVMEIVDYNENTGWAYAVNGVDGTLAAIAIKDIEQGDKIDLLDGNNIDIKKLVNDDSFVYGDMTSVAVSPDGAKLAVAVQAEGYADAGRVAIFGCNPDGTLDFERTVTTGVQPDMVTFTDDGAYILTANEGEPREGYDSEDPEGTVTVIDTTSYEAVNAGFENFDRDVLTNAGVVIKKGSTPAEDLEPEYIACEDGKAYVTLQEANSVAVLDIESKSFTGVYSLGTVDYSNVKIDLNKNDNEDERGYSPDNYNDVLGLRMPDGISAYKSGDKTYIITANEGDSREWGDYSNESEGKLTSVSGVKTDKKVTYLNSDDYDGLESGKTYLYGSRSFSIYEVTDSGIDLVFDSGSDFEAKTAEYLPEYFNCSNDSLDIDDRSNKKGPEPETVTTGIINGREYAFVTLERTGGIMVYDITDPGSAEFVNYINSRDFSVVTGADDSPEGLCFIPGSDGSSAMLLAACEVGGTVAAYEITGAQSDNLIKIYFTNDVHCAYENYARAASIVEDNDLLIDAGDNIQGDIIGTISDGGYMVDIMNYMGYDAAVPGNHEFDYGMDRFFEIAKGSETAPKLANYDYLSCNFRDIKTNTTLLDPYKIYNAEGKKVAVIGISTPETLTKSNPAYFKNEAGEWIYDFSNDTTGELLYSAVQTAVDDAKEEGADYIIAVGHLGTDEESEPWTSTEVIANTNGIDAFIDGHSHSTFNTVAVNDKGEEIPTVQTGTKLENVGCLTIDDNGNISSELIPIDETVEEDADVKEYIDSITAEFEETKNEVVASTEVKLTITDPATGERIIRNRETNLGDLCADAYRAITGADIAFVNGGGIRADIEPGDITYGDIIAVHPYGNEACMIEVTGQQIADALEWASASNPGESGGFLQVSGLTYEIHNYIDSPCVSDETGAFESIGSGERRVRNIKIGGEDIDYSKKYTLAGHNYMLLDFGDGFNMFEGAEKVLESVAIDNQVLINYITDDLGGTVSADSIYSDPYGEGRIKIVSEKPDNSHSTSGSGGGGGGNYAYSISADKTENGSVELSTTSTTSGRTVTITLKPNEGYKAESVSVKNASGSNISVNKTSDTTYTFSMPASKVTVSAVFVKSDETALPDEDNQQGSDTDVNSGNNLFNDVSENDWFFNAVKYSYENGIMDGTGESEFSPLSEVTRAMAVTVLYRMAGSPQSELSGFADVDKGAYYAAAAGWAANNGIVQGYDDTTFAPDDVVTREQLAAILYRYAESAGEDTDVRGDLTVFTDSDNISDYAYEALAWANGKGLINGNGDETINPIGGTTRAELAAILMRYSEAE